jgi:hypothetical protein
VEHPYRPTDGGPSSQARVLAGPNRARTGFHLGLILALLIAGGWALSVTLGTWIAWVVAVITMAVAADFVRTLHETAIPHRVNVDSRGIELVWAEKVPWRPWMRRCSHAIAWSELFAVRTSTVSVNGVGSTTLWIDHLGGPSLAIPDGTFSVAADALQQAILDERDDRIEAPRREAAEVAAFCRERFATPRTFRLRPNLLARAGATFFALFLIGVGTYLGFAIGGAAFLWLAPGPLAGGVLLWATWTTRNARVVRLQADGLAHGASEARLDLVPWSDIRFARPTVLNGTIIFVRVATKQGRDVYLGDRYDDVAITDLALMISPPVEMVLRAREQAGRA